MPSASARQHPENQKENQAGHSSERTVEGHKSKKKKKSLCRRSSRNHGILRNLTLHPTLHATHTADTTPRRDDNKQGRPGGSSGRTGLGLQERRNDNTTRAKRRRRTTTRRDEPPEAAERRERVAGARCRERNGARRRRATESPREHPHACRGAGCQRAARAGQFGCSRPRARGV